MKKQLLTSNKNLHGDHHYGLFDGLLGSIHTVLDTDNDTLEVGATVLSKYAGDIKEMLDIGVNLGMSIGGAPTEYDRNKAGGWTVKNARLDEISLTGMPANADTLGSVTAVHKNNIVEGTCFAGVCNRLLKNMIANDDEDLKEEESDDDVHASAPDDETKTEIRTVVDELWSEKEQGVVETVTNSMERKVVDIVHETINHDKEDSNMSTKEKKESKPNEEEEVEETNTTPNNEEEEKKESSNKKKKEEEEEEKVEKSITKEEVTAIVNKAIDDKLEKTLDSKFDSFHERFFKNLEETRKPESHTDLTKSITEEKTEPSAEPGMRKTYSTDETAEIIMKKQLSKNPLVNAISQNL